MKCELDMHSADDLVMCLVDFMNIDRFDGVHQGYGVSHVEGKLR